MYVPARVRLPPQDVFDATVRSPPIKEGAAQLAQKDGLPARRKWHSGQGAGPSSRRMPPASRGREGGTRDDRARGGEEGRE
eukprot:2952312-Alexandrium_andersonii.AAC.1